jgi:hypothetical protein
MGVDHYHLELPFPWVEYVDLGGDVSREIHGSAANRHVLVLAALFLAE